VTVAARRAVVRWSWRLFRREWRQQVLVLLLLTTTVTGAVYGALAARSLIPNSDGEFGSASHTLDIAVLDPAELRESEAALTSWFGTVDVIGSRPVAVPGAVNTVEYRSQDPDGAYGSPMLALRSGHFPTVDEIAVTEGVAEDQDVRVGDTLDLDGTTRPVVGIIENPADLADEFALVPPGDPASTSHTVLVQATNDRVRELPTSVHIEVVSERGNDETTTAAVAALSVAMVVAILVCLVAAAGFVVIAQRRLRQLGMLAAIGATERHLRLVVVANGVVVGMVAAIVGAVLSVVAWLATSPLLESSAGHRLDRYDLPWWIVVAAMVLALLTATAAAWWPGRAVSRVPITMALSSRPPQPRSVHRSAVVALGLVVGGAVGLAAGVDNTNEEANALLVLPAIAALVAGLLLLSPLAIRALTPIGRRTPIAVRLAVRDVIRYQARSSVALAAITLSLGLAVTTVIVAGAAEDGPTSGNLSDQQMLVRLGTSEPMLPALSDEAIADRQSEVEELSRTLDAAVVPLMVAISPAPEMRDGVEHHPIVVLGRRIPNGFRDAGLLYVATSELTGHLGIDVADVDPTVDVLTPEQGDLGFANTPVPTTAAGKREEDPAMVVQAIDVPDYSAAPSSLVMPASVDRHGWQAASAGWILETDQPLTAAQIIDAREQAERAGFAIEVRDEQEALSDVRTAATLVGMAMALAILAMTVGLIRGEATRELQTLVAAGATSGTRRTIVAATAGALALLGVAIGIAGAYLALIAAYLDDLEPLSNVPLAHLVAVAIGVPLLASAAGWLLSGRDPLTSRPALE